MIRGQTVTVSVITDSLLAKVDCNYVRQALHSAAYAHGLSIFAYVVAKMLQRYTTAAIVKWRQNMDTTVSRGPVWLDDYVPVGKLDELLAEERYRSAVR